MKNIRLLGILVLILLMGNSCKSYRNLKALNPKTKSSSIAEELYKLKPGDKIKVFENSGSIKFLKYSNAEDGVLKGIDIKGNKGTKGEVISIRVENLVHIEVRKTNWPLTALLIPTVGLVSLFGFYVILMGSQGGYN
ncbi:hypothetical protein [Aquiflexum sp.]|uniref:hypothetical protein n=1 Tax=Aquiflexum sp. TaxID=1872584 RepID=UPI0035934468